MIVVIEGADGTGKSTLANSLARYFNAKVIHRTHITDQPKSELYSIYENLIMEHKDHNVILDRAWYSEMAYGPVFRDKSHISIEQMHDLEKLIHLVGGFIIYCHNNDSYKLSQTRGEDYVENEEQHIKVCEAYEQLFHGYEHKVEVLEYVI